MKTYDTPVEAAVDWAESAVQMTLRSNKEYSSRIVKHKNGYAVTKPVRGGHSNVIVNAFAGCFVNLFREAHFIHTHPDCSCHNPDKFSGDPRHPLKCPGDYTVVEALGYKSVFLVSPKGEIFRYPRGDGYDKTDCSRPIAKVRP